MLSALPSTKLAKGAPNNAAFFTTVGAARFFIERRMQGKYRDLMALIEFGDDAYVITPFTTDYENILLSTTLIGDWNEFMAFPDQGTVVARAVEQAVGLYQAFDYLDSAGNLMVIFTDGADADVLENGKTVDDVLGEAMRAKIPVYLIKIGGNIANKRSVADDLWIGAVQKTGGKFFSGADEQMIIEAIRAIDRSSPGQDRDEAVQHGAAAVRAVRADGCGAVVPGPADSLHGADVSDVSVTAGDQGSAAQGSGDAGDQDSQGPGHLILRRGTEQRICSAEL